MIESVGIAMVLIGAVVMMIGFGLLSAVIVLYAVMTYLDRKNKD